MAKVILITGKQGSGKTTISATLGHKYERVRPVKFAQPLYELGELIYATLNSRYHMELETKTPAFKRLLQVIGTEWGRDAVSKNIWVKCAQNVVNYPAQHPDNVYVFDDARFPNELDAFPGALRVRLLADEDVRKSRTDRWRENVNHESETALDGIPNEMFDLVAHTGPNGQPPAVIAEMIMGLLEMKNAKEA